MPRFKTQIQAENGIIFGLPSDTNLFRYAADHLRTDDKFTVADTLGVGVVAAANTRINGVNTVVDPAAAQYGTRGEIASTQSAANAVGLYGMDAKITIAGSGGNTGIISALNANTVYNNSGAGSNINGGSYYVTQGALSGGVTTGRAVYLRVDNQHATQPIANAYGIVVANNIGAGPITNNIGIDVNALVGTGANYGVRITMPTGGATNIALELSSTSGTPSAGIRFGGDTNLYRSAADTLKTDDAFSAASLFSSGPVNVKGPTATGAYVGFIASTLANTGYVHWFNPAGARMSYIGYDPNDMVWSLEAGAQLLISQIAATGLVAEKHALRVSQGIHVFTTPPALQRANLFNAPTYQATNPATTMAAAATLVVSGAPIAGTNLAITNSYAMYVQSGNARFDGQVILQTSGNTGGLVFTIDTNLYRGTADFLKTDDNFGVGAVTTGGHAAAGSYIGATGFQYWTRASANNSTVLIGVTGDTVQRFTILADGRHDWGPGGAGALDTNLYRQAADILKTDDSFITGARTTNNINTGVGVALTSGGTVTSEVASVANTVFSASVTADTVHRYRITADGKIEWGDGAVTRDTNLYRSAANLLKTDDAFEVGGQLILDAGLLISTGAGAAKVLTSDASGNATWQAPTGGSDPLKANLASPIFSGTVTTPAITVSGSGKTMVALADTGTQTSGITIGGDSNIYRLSLGGIATDNSFFSLGNGITANFGGAGQVQIGAVAGGTFKAGIKLAGDASATLYRDSSGVLKTDGALEVTGEMKVEGAETASRAFSMAMC